MVHCCSWFVGRTISSCAAAIPRPALPHTAKAVRASSNFNCTRCVHNYHIQCDPAALTIGLQAGPYLRALPPFQSISDPALLQLAGMNGVARCGARDANGCGGWGKVTGKERCEWCGSSGVEGFQTLNPSTSLPFPGVLEPEAIPEGDELCSQGEPAGHVWLLRVSVEGVGGCERAWEGVGMWGWFCVPGPRAGRRAPTFERLPPLQ